MKARIIIWASVGFFVACCWIGYTLVTPPDVLLSSLREPVVRVGFVTCPIIFLGLHVPLAFWWIPPINAAIYAIVGLLFEILRPKPHSAAAT